MKQSKLAAIVIASVLVALVLAVSGCTVGTETEEYSDPSVPIEVEKGSDFIIVLESNPTTGYQWQLAAAPDSNVISLAKTEFVEPDTKNLGAPGHEKWTFSADGVGETTISLTYIRPWEEQSEPANPPVESERGEQPAEEQPTPMTFHVTVVKKGALTATPKKYEDENTPIEAEQNLEFEIVLEANHTTGYQWQLAEPLDDSIIELVSTEYAKKAGEGETVGGGGEETWTFKPVGTGDTKISLELVRPWETGANPAEEKAFTVTVSPSSG